MAYLDLLRAYQQQAIAQETLEHARQLADLTAAFARAGQGAQADANRARAELAVRETSGKGPTRPPRSLPPGWWSCSAWIR